MYPLSCIRELQLLVLVQSCVFCRVSSEIKKCNFEMKKSLRWTILVHTIALHEKSFGWATVSTEYKPLMWISKSTRHALDLYSTRVQKYQSTATLP